jgi:hypothetical protein
MPSHPSEHLGLFDPKLLDTRMSLVDWLRRHPPWVAGFAVHAVIERHVARWDRACELAAAPLSLARVPRDALRSLLEWSIGRTRDPAMLVVHADRSRRASLAMSRLTREAAFDDAGVVASAVADAMAVELTSAECALSAAEQIARLDRTERSGDRLAPADRADALLRPLLVRVSSLGHSRRLLLRVGFELLPSPAVASILSWAELAGEAADIAREIASRHRYADACWAEIRDALAIGDKSLA